ncbi:MAG: DUF1353 domain-containing protein [Actinobacteria bacterium]|nr:DUF1353 domain-containing protein [Actinomycetota bacterium]MCA1806486.1 DUF1353 domain-containing protein [Actinomycetota bacterium]
MTEKIVPSTSQPISSPAYYYDSKTGLASLRETVYYETGIGVEDLTYILNAALYTDGTLRIDSGFTWDFASGPAVNTPSMVYASLAHDALSRMTIAGVVPWSVRKQADQYFRDLLKQFGEGWLRRTYSYLAVRLYSTTVAKASRKSPTNR